MERFAHPEARRPQNWEALQALESVSPPSPSPSFGPDFMETLCSVGEIPIILDRNLLQSSDSDAFSFEPAVGTTLTSASSSTATLETIGTFGPTRNSLSDNLMHNTRFDFSGDSVDACLAPVPYTTHTRGGRLLPPHEGGYYDTNPGETSSFTISAYLSPSTQHIQDANSMSFRGTPTSNSPTQSQDTSARSHRSARDTGLHAYNTFTSLSTMQFIAPPASASSSTVTDLSTDMPTQPPYKWSHSPDAHNARQADSPSHVPRSLTPTLRASNVGTSSLQPLFSASSSSMTFLRPLSRTRSSSTINSIDSERSSHSGKSARSERSTISARSLLPLKLLPCGSHAMSGLPDALSWMANVTLELWIDQEGFRLIRPAFTLANYSAAAEPLDGSSAGVIGSLALGVAHFHPVKKGGYLFHHAALEPPPVLRKLTMADDDTRDYISRQATLLIKQNGLYSVGGSEAFNIGSTSHHTATTTNSYSKLTWRFEYRVEDAVRGKTAEKLLTPLFFSCSPGLLHPAHGKKIKVLHVVKKNFAPKLSAKVACPQNAEQQQQQLVGRFNDPHPPVPVLESREFVPRTAHGAETRVTQLLHVAHRRAHSTTAKAPSPDDMHPGEVLAGSRSGAQKCTVAAMVGTGTGTSPPPGISLRWDDAPDGSRSAVDASSAPYIDTRTDTDTVAPISSLRPLARHIVPPSELAHMLERPSPAKSKSAVRLRTSLPPPPPHRVMTRAHDQEGNAWK